VAAAIAPVYLSCSPARADAPLTYLRTHGLHADAATPLLWGMIIISAAVVLIVTVLLLGSLYRRRPAAPDSRGVVRPSGGIVWIATGVAISALVLFAVTVWTVVTLAQASRIPGGDPGLRLEVIGHQWWWEVRYLNADPSQTFTTANEIHIPAQVPVEVALDGTDVIHSFWVPALMGKTDIIPGQTNLTWIEAAAPGVYRGQCTEYCGLQHAHMALQMIADMPADFAAWRANQLKSVPEPQTQELKADQGAFVQKCGVCHSVRGTRAGGILGPDLSHFMTRKTLAAGTLPNTPGHLSAWIADPQHIKPGALMPRLDLSGPDLARVRKFLGSLE
jgi:cytochrome c oxidase subunit 2